MAKPVHAGSTNFDTYRQKNMQLASKVFEQTDYQEHAPISKNTSDLDNASHDIRVQARGRLTDDEFRNCIVKQEPVKRDYEG